MVVTGERKLQIEGRLRVIEMTGAWSVYAGERIVIGPGDCESEASRPPSVRRRLPA